MAVEPYSDPYPNDFRSYNRGPLTTTFTPASTCLATTSEYIGDLAYSPSQRPTTYYIGLWPDALPDYITDLTSNPCFPTGATSIAFAEPAYYSPGICPSGYTPAASLATDGIGEYGTSAVLPTSLTAWLCCPS